MLIDSLFYYPDLLAHAFLSLYHREVLWLAIFMCDSVAASILHTLASTARIVA